jgi:hypothetical protein
MARVQSVWENAPGRYDEEGNLLDKWVGVQIQGVRKTQSGYVWNDWWFFLRHFPDKEASYWYKKKRLPAKAGEEEGEIVEEYVGKELPFEVPPELAEAKWGVLPGQKTKVKKKGKKPVQKFKKEQHGAKKGRIQRKRKSWHD